LKEIRDTLTTKTRATRFRLILSGIAEEIPEKLPISQSSIESDDENSSDNSEYKTSNFEDDAAKIEVETLNPRALEEIARTGALQLI